MNNSSSARGSPKTKRLTALPSAPHAQGSGDAQRQRNLGGDIARDLLASSAQVHAPRCSTLQPHALRKPASIHRAPNVRYRLSNVDDGAFGFMRMNLTTLHTIEETAKFHADREAEKARSLAGPSGGALAVVPSSGVRPATIPIITETEYEAQYPLKLQLHIWVDAFNEELSAYRSNVIAAELLQHRVAQCCQGLGEPNLLSTATALIIFTSFLPHLGKYRELARGVLEELGHAVYVSPSRSIGVSTAADTFTRKPFYESFNEALTAFSFHHSRSKKYTMMMDREKRVLDRAVTAWQKSVCKKMLLRWRAFTKRHHQLRSKYARIFAKASTGAVVQRLLVVWRQYAHGMHMRVVESRNSRTVEELSVAHRLQRQAHERLEASQEEAQRRERQLKDLTTGVARLRRQFVDAKHAVDKQERTLESIRAAWIDAVGKLFGDVHTVPTGGNYAQWIDQLLPDEAPGSPATSQALLRRTSTALGNSSRAKISGNLLHRLMERLCPPHISLARHFKATSLSTATIHAEKVCMMFRLFTGGIPPPLSADDIVRGDQLRIRCLLFTLMELRAGGCCSLYFPNDPTNATAISAAVAAGLVAVGAGDTGPPSERPTPAASRRPSLAAGSSVRSNSIFGDIAAVESHATFSGSGVYGSTRATSEEGFDADSVKFRSRFQSEVRVAIAGKGGSATGAGSDASLMSEDWETGLAMLGQNAAFNLHTQRSLAEATQLAETVQLHRDGKRLFDLVASSSGDGRHVPREILEQSLRRFVTADQMTVIELLYPDDDGGITNITDIINYVMEIAEVIDRPSTYVLRNLEEHLVVSTAMNFLIDVKSDDVQFVVRTFLGEIRHCFKIYSVGVLRKKGREGTQPPAKAGPRLVRKGGAGATGSTASAAREVTLEGFENFCQFSTVNTGVEIEREQVRALYEGLSAAVEEVDEFAFTALICAVATHLDPSPFVPLHVKTKAYLSQLFRTSSDFSALAKAVPLAAAPTLEGESF